MKTYKGICKSCNKEFLLSYDEYDISPEEEVSFLNCPKCEYEEELDQDHLIGNMPI